MRASEVERGDSSEYKTSVLYAAYSK